MKKLLLPDPTGTPPLMYPRRPDPPEILLPAPPNKPADT